MINVELQRKNHIAFLTISDEKGMNVLCSNMIHEMDSAVGEIQKDKEIYCLVISGAGNKAFAAGANVAEMHVYNNRQIRDYIFLGSNLFRKIEMLEIPVIAAVNGYALGGGCELACACDIRILSETAVLGQPEVGLGIIPGYGGTQRLARLIGEGRARELIFTGRNVKADEALAIGLANKVVSCESLLSEAEGMAEKIAKKAPVAIRMAKKAMNFSLVKNLDAALANEDALFFNCFDTEDRKNAMQAFLEKKALDHFANR
jgi:enoyl-CoA hydratase